MRNRANLLAVLAGMFVAGCGSSSSVKDEATAITVPVTSESLYHKGHALYTDRQLDSAIVYLEKSLQMDSVNLRALNDLALIHYDLAMRQPGEKDPVRLRELGSSYSCYKRMEASGRHDAEVYARLTELSYALDRRKEFLAFAKADWEQHPSDRQAYNLGLAYSLVADHANVIETQKQSIPRFPHSPFLGGFYRLLGNAYLEIDRDQTAERTFTKGVSEVDERIGEMVANNPEARSSREFGQMQDDKVAMLLALKKLARRYGSEEKLRDVERQLNNAGR